MQPLIFQLAQKILEVLKGVDRYEAIDALDVARIMLRPSATGKQISRFPLESEESPEAFSSAGQIDLRS